LHNADFQSIFARSASDVTPSKKISINTNSKSTTRCPISLRGIVYVDPKPPKGGSKTQYPKFKQQSAITSNRNEIGGQLLLITNRKSHTIFRLVPTSVTLYDLERRNSPYFFISPNSIALQSYYVTVIGETYIVCRISFFAFGQNWPTLQRDLCDSWATCLVCDQSSSV